MKKTLVPLIILAVLTLSTCVEKRTPPKLILSPENQKSNYGTELIISPMDETVSVDGNDITIAPEHEDTVYSISGYLNGQITVKTKNTQLKLENAYIENTEGKAAIKCTAKAEISAARDSTNYIISSGRNFSKNAALQSKRGLVIGGSGKLYVMGNNYHGVEAEDVKMKGSGTYYLQGSWKGSALTCESFTVESDKEFTCYCINSKNGIKADSTIKINSGTFYLYNNETALKTELSKSTSAKARGITLAGGVFHTYANKVLERTDKDAYTCEGATFIED